MDTESYKLQSTSYAVKLKKTFMKINYLLPAANQTFAFLGMKSVGVDWLIHCDKLGNILFEFKFQNLVDNFGMVNNRQVIICDAKANSIYVFNLENHNHFVVPHNFIREYSDQINLYTFANTKLICISEIGSYNDNRIKLNYYSTPLKQTSKPVYEYESDHQWNYQYIMKKVNEDSMIAWYKPRHDEEFQIKICSVVNQNGMFKVYKMSNTLNKAYNVQEKLQISLINVWQVRQHQFCLVCCTQKTFLGLRNAEGMVNNNFIWNVQLNEMRQLNFWFQQKYNDFLIDIYSFGSYAVFHTYDFQNGAVKPAPCYYISNSEQKIVASETSELSHRLKYLIPGYDNVLIQNQYQNGNVSEFKSRIIKINKIIKQ